ncbi:MAG: hypothetical protein V4668_01835 [Patescibacteria group bacterium]
MRTTVSLGLLVLVASIVMFVVRTSQSGTPPVHMQMLEPLRETNEEKTVNQPATERYEARVDRVNVIFEQWDYRRFRLQTNDLIREGDMNSERGFENDTDASVYVLNWQKPEGEHIRYVRLTAEPDSLYVLDSDNKIIKGSKLTRK